MVVFGTYPGDFNMVEYGQKLRHFLPELKAKGIDKFVVVVNGEPASCAKLASLLDLPSEIELLSDPSGEAGRSFGVSRGWRADDTEMNAYFKLWLMLFGLGLHHSRLLKLRKSRLRKASRARHARLLLLVYKRLRPRRL